MNHPFTARVAMVGVLASTILVAPTQVQRPAYAVAETATEVIETFPEPDPAEIAEAIRDGSAAASTATDGAPVDGVTDAEAGNLSGSVEAPITFSMIGFEASRPGDLEFRVSLDGEAWEPWQVAEFAEADDGPEGAERADAHDPERFTEPFWVGEAAHVQIRSAQLSTDDVRAHVIDSMGLSATLPQRALSLAQSLLEAPQPVSASAASVQPTIVTRAQWGADESWRSGSPRYNDDVGFAVVHHTAGGNDYSAAEAPGVVRGIYSYHTRTKGWADIGYNFLIDKYGVLYEGRAGGMDRGVIGAHARDFNSGSFGVSLMGNYDVVRPTSTSISAMNTLIAWKFDTHMIDPTLAPARSGVANAIVGHRDVGESTCPGRYVVELMSSIRKTVAARTDFRVSKMTPLTGDWDGDGVDTSGWFYEGRWFLRNSHSAGAPDLELSYGEPGDIPVTGDWNGDGRDTVGVVRPVDGVLQFILRRTYNRGDDVVLSYGQVGDVPVTGDWNGDGIDTLGVVRGNTWILRYVYRRGADIVMQYGAESDRPVTGDWNGDGTDTIGVLRGNTWILRYLYRSGSDIVMDYGTSTDRPVTGDWNGDGADTLGVTRDYLRILRYAYRSGADYVYSY